MEFVDTLVCGAGPVGLSFALEAKRLGLSTKLFDKKSYDEKLTQFSNASNVNSRTLDLMEASGLTSKLKEQGTVTDEVCVVDEASQSKLIIMNFRQMNVKNNYLVLIPQAKTETILRELLYDKYGFQVNWGIELIKFEEVEEKHNGKIYNIRAELKDIKQSTIQVVYAQYLIGTDGVHSIVRKSLKIEFEGKPFEEELHVTEYKGDIPSLYENSLVIPDRKCMPFVMLYIGKGVYRTGLAGRDPLTILPPNVKVEKVTWHTKYQPQLRQAVTYQKGHVFIAGDAAHCHTPAGGRGMNLGIEDAVILAHLIKRGDTSKYTELRHPIGKETIKNSTNIIDFL